MLRFIKRIVKFMVFNKFIARLLIKPILKLHNLTYMLSGMYASIVNDGIHPKFKILDYQGWFLANIEEGWNVLDIGCNTGALAYSLSEKSNMVYGIEIIEKLVEISKKNRQKNNIEYIYGDATVYDYSNCKPIDCVVLSNVLEHIEQRVEFLIKIKDTIKWNSDTKKVFLIRVPVMDRDWITLYKKSMGIEWRLDNTHFIEYTLDKFREEINNSGLEILSTKVKFGEIYAVCQVINKG